MLLVLLPMMATEASGQIPRSLSYQGYLLDVKGKPVNDSARPMVFRLYDRPDATRPVYEELRLVAVESGLFVTPIGPLPPSVDFSGPVWLAVIVDGEQEGSRTMLMPSPYALHAERASTLDDDAPLVERVADLEQLCRDLLELVEKR